MLYSNISRQGSYLLIYLPICLIIILELTSGWPGHPIVTFDPTNALHTGQ